MKRFAAVFMVLALFACSKPIDVPKGLPPLTPEAAVVQPNVAPVANQPVVNVKPVGLQKPTRRLSKHAENQAEVASKPSAKAAKYRGNGTSAAEAAAYAKAYRNAERANALLGEDRFRTTADAPLLTSGDFKGLSFAHVGSFNGR